VVCTVEAEDAGVVLAGAVVDGGAVPACEDETAAGGVLDAQPPSRIRVAATDANDANAPVVIFFKAFSAS